MQIDGKGGVGHTRGTAVIDLAPAEGGTEMRYSANVQVGGTIAAVGQRMLESVGRSMMKQALESLDRELKVRLAGGERRMKPAPFAYHAPSSIEEALALLHEHGYDAKPLAGGQSLIPAMNFRLATPAVLVDLNRIAGLSSLSRDGAASGSAR